MCAPTEMQCKVLQDLQRLLWWPIASLWLPVLMTCIANGLLTDKETLPDVVLWRASRLALGWLLRAPESRPTRSAPCKFCCYENSASNMAGRCLIVGPSLAAWRPPEAPDIPTAASPPSAAAQQ